MIGGNGDRVPVYTVEKARANVRIGSDPILEAHDLQRFDHYSERVLWRKFGHPGSESSIAATRRVVYAKTPHRLDAERRLEREFGGDMVEMVESLRRTDDATSTSTTV